MAKELKVRQPKAITPRRSLVGLTRRERDLERLVDDFFDKKSPSLVAGEMVAAGGIGH